MSLRKKYALVGTGGRAALYIDALAGTYREHAELAAFCDVSSTRMAYYNRRMAERFCAPPASTYAAADFGRMLAEVRPDAVIVVTPDATHDGYVVRALEAGCDAICEKPLATDAGKARRILEAVKRTGRRLTVVFNCRYMPAATEVRKLVRDGAVGRPLAVDLSWMLDTRHGADYFRRWHADKENSGGLQIHKASHHFDLVNWWLGSRPERVFALGGLKFYGRENAVARGDGRMAAYPRYTGHPEAGDDPFALRLDETAELRGLYLEAEADSGYLRDRNVFRENITIEDTLAVTARYGNGVVFNYSLIAYSPREGFQVAITGDRGRLELSMRMGSHIIAGQGEKELAAAQAEGASSELMLYPMFGTPRRLEIPEAQGSHGGGDALLLEQILSPRPPADPFNRAATHTDGAAALLMGVAINESLRAEQVVETNTLLDLDAV